MPITRNLEKAREAWQRKDEEMSIKAHQVKEPHETKKGQYIKSIVYGGLDGIITTFAIVAGITGAKMNPSTVLILGIANLLADAISMGVGDYLSTKSEIEYQKKERSREKWEVENYPEGEKLEIVQLFHDKGMSKEDARKIAAILENNKKAWIDTMMIQELGFPDDKESALKNGGITFLSFIIFGIIPLFSYILALLVPTIGRESTTLFVLAIFLTAVTLFILGALKTRITKRNIFLSGLESLVVGGLAAGAAYILGDLLSGITL